MSISIEEILKMFYNMINSIVEERFSMNQTNRVEGISQKYDGALDYGIDMYDHLPYQRDSDICNASTLALYSGHIIKYYLCNNQEEEYPINNRDDEIEEILQKIREKEALRNLSDGDGEVLDVPTEDITEEQIQTLLEDSDQDTAEEEPPAAPTETVNLDDIEDW